MGCASSKSDINDQHPNIFQVMNVNEDFRPISPGQIEITDTELIFYQRAKNPTTWSLRNLRKYGFDGEIFSFECGRRCATGEGIFAFKCRKAEQLFNLLQHNIQVRNLSEESHELTTSGTGTTTTATNQREVQRRNTSEGYLNPVTNGRPTLSRPGSITSNGPTTPPPTQQSTTPIPHPQENNNNKNPTVGCIRAVGIRQSSLEHSYLNLTPDVILEAGGHINTPYINIPNPAIVENPSLARSLYMNVDTALAHQSLNAPSLPVTIQEEGVHETDDEKNVNEAIVLPQLPSEGCATCFEDVHCYANIDAATSTLDGESFTVSVPPTPMEVNYVELDLEPSGKNSSGSGPTSTKAKTCDSPIKGKSYVTIDFKKTDALSHSINPRLELEEGCRKTRHNSTIADIRHSSSISD